MQSIANCRNDDSDWLNYRVLMTKAHEAEDFHKLIEIVNGWYLFRCKLFNVLSHIFHPLFLCFIVFIIFLYALFFSLIVGRGSCHCEDKAISTAPRLLWGVSFFHPSFFLFLFIYVLLLSFLSFVVVFFKLETPSLVPPRKLNKPLSLFLISLLLSLSPTVRSPLSLVSLSLPFLSPRPFPFLYLSSPPPFIFIPILRLPFLSEGGALFAPTPSLGDAASNILIKKRSHI